MVETPVSILFFGLLLPPLVAFVYAASVLGMYAGFHEWTFAEKLPALAWRFALLGGSCAVTYGDRFANENGSDISVDSRISMLAIQAALLWTLSAYFVFETRLEDVVGGLNPNNKLDKQTLQNKIVLITGSNAGIGKETARQLAALGATKIILACRSPRRGQQAMEELLKNQKDEDEKKKKSSQFIVLECDLGSFESIRTAVDTLKNRQLEDIPQIDVLILNAGVMMSDRVITKDGCETMMQANVLGHFLLTRLLLEKNLLKPNKKNPPRVLHLSSSTHQIAVQGHGGMDLDDIFCSKGERKYTLFGQYGHSKLGNILMAKELARRYPNKLISLAVHPGIARTDVTRNMPLYLKYPNQWLGVIIQQYQKTVAQGAWCSVAGATTPVDMDAISSHEMDGASSDPNLEAQPETEDSNIGDSSISKGIPNGSYLQNGKVRQTDPYTYAEADARKLWDMSEKLVGFEQK